MPFSFFACSDVFVQGLDAVYAHIFTAKQEHILGIVTEDAGGLVFAQHDGVAVHVNLQRVLGLNIQRVAQFDGQDNAAKLIHFSYNTG